MAAVRLPVLQERDPFARPRTVGDCENGIRPCPRLWCKHNLLADVLEDGSLVLNYPSSRYRGADRTIPDKHSNERSWFVIVCVRKDGEPTHFALGPCDSQPRAQEIAEAWQVESGGDSEPAELVRARSRADAMVARASARAAKLVRRASEHAEELVAKAKDRARRVAGRRSKRAAARDRARQRGLAIVDAAHARGREAVADQRRCGREIVEEAKESARAIVEDATPGPLSLVCRDIPDRFDVAATAAGAIDRKFEDELDDAVDYWFDEPRPDLRSCVLDEVKRLHDSGAPEEEYLLEQIAVIHHVSRERVRQTEVSALAKVKRAGLTLHDVLDED